MERQRHRASAWFRLRDAERQPLDRAASYRVTINNFLADGGDGFHVRAGRAAVVGHTDIEAMIDYPTHSPLTRDSRTRAASNNA